MAELVSSSADLLCDPDPTISPKGMRLVRGAETVSAILRCEDFAPSDLPGLCGLYTRKTPMTEFKVFSNALVDLIDYGQLTIKGNEHRRPEARDIVRKRSSGCIVLLVPEPKNPYDPNAIACYMTRNTDANPGVGYSYEHVGYIKKESAARLKRHWPQDEEGNPFILTGAFKRQGSMLYVELSNDAQEGCYLPLRTAYY